MENSNLETEIIYGQVVAKANNYMAVPASNGEKRIIKNDKIRKYEASFLSQCKIYKNRNISNPFQLNINVYYISRSSDLDNSLKTILDCLQMVGAITNDNLCYSIKAEKRISSTPRVEFSIQEINQQLSFL